MWEKFYYPTLWSTCTCCTSSLACCLPPFGRILPGRHAGQRAPSHGKRSGHGVPLSRIASHADDDNTLQSPAGGKAVNPVGIFAKTFPRPTPEENLDAVRNHGLGVVQYNLACAGLPSLPERIEPDLARRIGAAAALRGIGIAAVSGTFNMIDPIRRRRDVGTHRLGQRASGGAVLGTKIITLCTWTREPDGMW